MIILLYISGWKSIIIFRYIRITVTFDQKFNEVQQYARFILNWLIIPKRQINLYSMKQYPYNMVYKDLLFKKLGFPLLLV